MTGVGSIRKEMNKDLDLLNLEEKSYGDDDDKGEEEEGDLIMMEHHDSVSILQEALESGGGSGERQDETATAAASAASSSVPQMGQQQQRGDAVLTKNNDNNSKSDSGDESTAEESLIADSVVEISVDGNGTAYDNDDDDDDEEEEEEERSEELDLFESNRQGNKKKESSASELLSSTTAALAAAATGGPSYHPAIMFCGECTSCAEPPPPTIFIRRKRHSASNKQKIIATNNVHGTASNYHQRKRGLHQCDDEACLANNVSTFGEADAMGRSPTFLLEEHFHKNNNDDDEEQENNIELTDLTTSRLHELNYRTSSNHNNNSSNSERFTFMHLRTSMYVPTLTCPSQILVIQSVLRPLPGVARIFANLDHPSTAQLVFVDHDPFITSANQLLKSIKDLGHDVALHHDGAADMLRGPSQHGSCKSTLYVEGICCNSEIPAVKSILEPLQGVSKVSINVTTRNVYIDHDPFVIPAQELAQALNKEGFGSKVKRDGMKSLPTSSNTALPFVGSPSSPPPMGLAPTTPPPPPHSSPSYANGVGSTTMPERGQGGQNLPFVDTKARSTFHVERYIREGDIRPIQQVASSIQGVYRVGINIAEGIIYVDHDTNRSTAQLIQHTLINNDYPVIIARDALDRVRERQQQQQQLLLQQQPQQQPQQQGNGGVRQGKTWSPSPSSSSPPSSASRYVESTLLVPNLITLDDCKLIERTVRQHYVKVQIRAFYPHVPSRTVKVEHNPQLLSAPSIAQVLRTVGLDATVSVDGAVENLALPVLEEYSDGGVDERNDKIKSGRNGAADDDLDMTSGLHFNVILSGLFWVVSMLSVVGGNWEYLEYAGLLSVLFGIPPVAAKAWRTLRRCQFDANCMMVVAAIGALALQEFDEAASVAFLFAVSEWLEARATAKARRALGAIVSLRPDHANVINPATKEIVIVPAANVPIGTTVSVRTGDKIPADGVIVEGTSTIDESSLTGEARPVLKRVDDTVSGGSINIGSTQLVVRTTSTVEDSAVSRLIRLVEEAQANRSPTEKLVDSFAKAYTPVVMFMAAIMCTVPWFFGRETGRYWTLNGLIIIVIACPCALTISTPVTYAAGLAATAQRGIIVKGGARLEALGNVKRVVFDKTGTLTKGKFALIHLDTVNGLRSRRELLELLALMEAPSSHPLSSTLVNAAKNEGVDIPKDAVVVNHTILKGEGVTATVNKETVYVGNARMFHRLGMYDNLPVSYKDSAEEWNKSGGTVGFVGIDGVGIIGVFCVCDAVREEARDVVMALHESGIDIIMLTGDGDGAAKAVARQVGLPDSAIQSQLLPEDKLHFIGSLKGSSSRTSSRCNPCARKDLTLMCGDGVNDAPALAVADIGVAMGEGAALAMEMSDVTLMDSNLSKLLYSLRMGSKVILTIKENIILSLFAKFLVVGLTFAGKMTLLWAIASDVGVMLVVTLNGMKLLPGRKSTSLKDELLERRKKAKATYDELPLDGSRNPDAVTEIV